MKKIFSFTKKKKQQFGTPDNGSVLSAGYDLKEKDLGKVHKAAFNGDLAKLKQLAKKNDINQLDKENRTALHIACASGHAEVVQFLVESKAKLNLCDNQNRSALMKAVQGQHERCVTSLLENHAEPNLVDINGNTALHLAANIPSVSTAMLLLEYGADINAQNKEGFTPLTVAVREDHIEMAEFLLKESADVNSVDQEQRSPLMLAAGNGQICMVKLLLKFNADITLTDTKGLPAEEYALMKGHHPCSLLITEHATQRTGGALVSYQGPSKKKKGVGNPSQDVEAGLSLGGPATDKNNVEDNSLSESASRVSKSAGDEWPSSDEDESLLDEKKPSKEFLNRMFASKKEASALLDTSLSGSESEPETQNRVERTPSIPKASTSSNTLPPSVDTPSGPLLPKASQMTSTPLPKDRKVNICFACCICVINFLIFSHKCLLKQGDSSAEEEGKHSEKHSKSDKSNDSHEESSEEDEEEEEDDDEEEDDEEEDEEDGDEEEENEEESVEEGDISSTADVLVVSEDLSRPSITDDAQITPVTDVPPRAEGEAGDASEQNTKAETEDVHLPHPSVITTYAMPVTLDVPEDCVVSAIRVESKFSDEEESLALRSSDQNRMSNQASLEVATPSPGEVKEPDRETGKDQENSWSHDGNGDEEDNKNIEGHSALITRSKHALARVGTVHADILTDGDDFAGLNKKVLKGEKRRSSWGSSLEGSDTDLPREGETLQQETGIEGEASQVSKTTSLPNEEHPHLFTSCHEPKTTPSVITADDSQWDSSENDDQDDVGSRVTCEATTIPENPAKEKLECSWEEDKGSIEKESNNPSPVVSALLEDDDGAGSVAQLSQIDDKPGSENEKEDSDWDDEDESDESEKQKRKETSALSNITLSSPLVELDKKVTGKGNADDDDGEVLPRSIIDDDYENMADDRHESSDDSDSKHQKLQYDFTKATVRKLDDGALLTSYVPLENRSLLATETRESCDDLNEGILSSPPTKDDDTFSDEALPQTDIDDVDVNSPDEDENAGVRQHGPGVEKEESTDDEDYSDKEQDQVKEEEEEEDVSDVNNQSEGGEESPVATSPAPEEEVSQNKKREFLSELGLEGGEEQDSFNSESNSENENVPHKDNQGLRTQNKEELSPTEAALGEPANISKEPNDKGDAPQKERTKWETLSVLNKPKENIDPKKDFMEELGLGDVDDLEDASDWDSASTTSKRTLPGRRMASPGLEELRHDSKLSNNDQEGDAAPAAASTPPRSFGSDNTPSKSAPQPQPRARTMLLQKPESEEESEKVTSPDDNPLKPLAEPPAAVEPGSDELSLRTEDSDGSSEFDEHQQKEKDDAVDRCELDVDFCGRGGSDDGQKDGDFGAEFSPHGHAAGDAPWEKRYEKLWVEVEKKEVKSTFKSVASELKEKFGELFKSTPPAENIREEAAAASTSAEEDSSDEEEGDVFVRPVARARSTVLVTIPEQRESGQEDSAAESPDEERMQGSSRVPHKLDLPNPDALESVSSQVNSTQKEHTERMNIKDFINDTSISSVVKEDPKTELDPLLKDLPADLSEADWNKTSSEDEPQQFSQSRRVPEEDRKGFKLEVGKVTFFGLETKKTQLMKEAGEETLNTAMKNQKSSASLDGGGTAVEEVGAEKPDPGSGFVLSHSGGIHQEQQPGAAHSTNRDPALLHLPVQLSCSSRKQEKQGVGEPLQLEVVRGARPSRAPQTSTHTNGDPLSVFDDSSLSDASDDEQRLTPAGQQKTKNSEDVDMAEEFDELTQSSDTATDDVDSPTSGYRHASLLIQKLDSVNFDSTSITKLQNIFHEYERSNQKLRSRHRYLSDKVGQLEMERAELKNSLEEVKDSKSVLERSQLELQTEITNLKFQLKQEQENRHNANMMYNTTRDKLRRTEEQQQLEIQERQKVELALRNLELEMRTLISNMKQLEDVHSETQRLLAQERSARTLQESLLSSHLRKQQEMQAENKRSLSRSNEALSQLTEASERERELLQQTAALQEQLSTLRTDLEQSQANSSLKESHLSEENEVLKEQLEDVRRDLKLSNETMTQTVFSCKNQLSAMKSELALTTNRLENERQTREALESELESTRSRLVGAVKEAELRLAAHSDSEKALLREKEEHQRLKDRLSGEVANQREAASSLSQKLAKAESRSNSMENEVHRVTLQLTEKSLLLEVLQREKDQAAARVKELESALQAERELVSRAGARHEATQERLAQTQSEAMLLRQQLEESQNKGVAKERAVTDAQERFSDILSKLRSDSEERVQLVEDRNKELAGKAADLRDQIYKLEEDKNERETSLRQLQQELADSLKKLSMSEASLEVNTRYRNDLEEEKARLHRDSDRLKGKLEESEDQYLQAERHISSLKSSLDEREKELSTAAQKLQEALSASSASEVTIKQLEDTVQRLEIENARLEAAAKQQSNRIESLQKGAQEAAMVRGHLEELVTNLQSSKMTLEEQLSREAQKQSVLSHTAQDSHALWEEELKSRSKLGLRLAELEKEKGELTTQMEIEKKKAKKISEQRKAIDARLDQEMKRNAELQKEMYRLRTLLKTAKKKLRDQEAGGAEFGSPVSGLRMDRHSQAEGTFGQIKDKVDNLQVQLEKETFRRSQLEKTNEELKVQIASMRSPSHNSDHLERSRRQVEEEVLDLRRRLETTQVDQSQMEQFRREAEERARQEIQQKLEQVNLFLQSQAASQEALDQIKAANEASLRSQLEQKIRELEGQLGRARTTYQDSLNQRDSTHTELERYRQLYTEEVHLRKSQAAKLERAKSRLTEANSKLLSERSRSLITSSITNGSLMGPSLDLSSLGSAVNYGATIGSLNRNFGLGLSLLTPATEGQSSRVEDYLTKMRDELDRSISRELSTATAELDAASVRMSLGGSATRVEMDPLSRATQEYLEVLKKNNRI